MSSDKYTVGNTFGKKAVIFGTSPFINDSPSGKAFRDSYLNKYFYNDGSINPILLPTNRAYKVSGTNLEQDDEGQQHGWVEVNKHWFRINTLHTPEQYEEAWGLSVCNRDACKSCGQKLPKPPVPQWFTAALTKIYRGERVVLASRSNYQTTRNEILPQLQSLFDQEGISVNIMRNNATVHFAKFRSTITIISTDSEQKYRGRSVTDMVLMDQIGFYSPDFINWYYSRGTHDYSGN